jgi:hypothetical protein
MALHYGAAGYRYSGEVLRQTCRHTVVIRNGMSAILEGIVYACLLLFRRLRHGW